MPRSCRRTRPSGATRSTPAYQACGVEIYHRVPAFWISDADLPRGGRRARRPRRPAPPRRGRSAHSRSRTSRHRVTPLTLVHILANLSTVEEVDRLLCDKQAREISSRLLRTEGKMSDVEKYIQKREAKNPNFRKELDEERRNLRIGMLIRELRLERGMTQEALAQQVRTTKSAISRLENHAENMTLATLEKVAHALGKVVHIVLSRRSRTPSTSRREQLDERTLHVSRHVVC